MVIPSEVEGSRGETLKVTWRDPSTSLHCAQDDGGICAMLSSTSAVRRGVILSREDGEGSHRRS